MLLFYCKLWGDLSSKGFEINPCDPWVTNKTSEGHQMTITWNFDNFKMLHKLPAVITGIIEWLHEIYGELHIS